MVVVEILLFAVVVFAVAAVVMGRGGSMTMFRPDWPGRPLPTERTLRADDVLHARFSLAFRGYRMGEVDDALDRLAREIAERDARIEQLTGLPYETLAEHSTEHSTEQPTEHSTEPGSEPAAGPEAAAEPDRLDADA